MCHIALATYHAARRYNRLYVLTNDTIACIREECYSLPEVRETMPDGTERNVTWTDVDALLRRVESQPAAEWGRRIFRDRDTGLRGAGQILYCRFSAQR